MIVAAGGIHEGGVARNCSLIANHRTNGVGGIAKIERVIFFKGSGCALILNTNGMADGDGVG